MENKINTNRIAYRPQEAAQAVGVSTPTIYLWMRRDGFPVLRVGGCTLIPKDEFEIWLSTVGTAADTT